MSLKQIFCRHWFDEQPTRECESSWGVIVCGSQRTYRVTIQDRLCSKCELIETRRIGEPVFEGWEP